MPGSGKHQSAGMSGDVDVFTNYLREWKKDWLLVERRGDQYAHLRFTGLFQGKGVVWDCQFSTLAEARARRNFIAIGLPGVHGVPLQVGLSVAVIDTPAIEKMIIMIRHYKRLKVGRHEYGETLD
jgi:hypothetical protein